MMITVTLENDNEVCSADLDVDADLLFDLMLAKSVGDHVAVQVVVSGAFGPIKQCFSGRITSLERRTK